MGAAGVLAARAGWAGVVAGECMRLHQDGQAANAGAVGRRTSGVNRLHSLTGPQEWILRNRVRMSSASAITIVLHVAWRGAYRNS